MAGRPHVTWPTIHKTRLPFITVFPLDHSNFQALRTGVPLQDQGTIADLSKSPTRTRWDPEANGVSMRQTLKDKVAHRTQQGVVDLDTKNRLCRQIVRELYDIRSLARMSDKGGFSVKDLEQACYSQTMRVLHLKLLDNIQSSPKAFADDRDDEDEEDEEEDADDVV